MAKYLAAMSRAPVSTEQQEDECSNTSSPGADAQLPGNESGHENPIYGSSFYIAFAANIALVVANTMSFRFAELVKFLHGSEETTGRIVSFGLVVSLFIRVLAGRAMDRFGIRRIWILSGLSFLAGSLWIMLATDLSWSIYVARCIFIVGLATMFACSVSHIQQKAPPLRRTEVIGTFGASGFLGMILGSQLVDFFFRLIPDSAFRYQLVFGWIFLMGLFNVCMALWLTSGDTLRPLEDKRSLQALLSTHFPASILLVTVMMGLGFSVTTVFLTRYATSLHLKGPATFFSAYAITAFSMRFVARRWSNIMGRHRMIWWGMLGHVFGHITLMFVTSDWQLMIPALGCGFGHALLFPCIVSLGSGDFPPEHRATGTTVVLASIDLGTVLTAPLLGYLIDNYGFRTMFCVSSSLILTFAVIYAALKYTAADEEMLAG
ncbi:MAG: MFS transporter [Planctomycetaceae bacterium]